MRTIQLKLSQPTIHVRVLEEAGLIVCRRKGQFVNSEANPKAIADYTRELAGLTRRKKK